MPNMGRPPPHDKTGDHINPNSNDGYLELVRYKKQTGSFFFKQKWWLHDSWEAKFDFTVDKGEQCSGAVCCCTPTLGIGQGFTFVIAESKGIGAGDTGLGYRGFPGRSIAVAFGTNNNVILRRRKRKLAFT